MTEELIYTKGEQGDSDATSFKGTVKMGYDNMVKIFGEPHSEGFYIEKIRFEWILKFEDGIVATIYDWKEDISPKEQKGLVEWHIGGHQSKAYYRVSAIINNYNH